MANGDRAAGPDARIGSDRSSYDTRIWPRLAGTMEESDARGHDVKWQMR